MKVLIKVEKESARIVYQIRKRTKQEKYEPKSTQKISEKSSNQPKTVSGERTRQKPMSEAIPSPSQNSQRVSGERTRKKEVYSSAKESERKKE